MSTKYLSKTEFLELINSRGIPASISNLDKNPQTYPRKHKFGKYVRYRLDEVEQWIQDAARRAHVGRED